MAPNFSAMDNAARGGGVGLIALLTALVAIGPISISIYIPALPDITRALDAPPGLAKLTMTLFLACYAAAQLVYGPLADAYGRRPVLFGGAGVAALGCAICAVAPGIETLIVGRAIQGLGACCGVVVVRAVVRDLFAPRDSLRIMGTVGAALALAPAIGPTLGGLIHAHAGWRWIFVLLIVALGGLMLIAARRLKESLARPDPGAIRFAQIGRTYAMLLGDGMFLRYALIGGFTFGGMFVYLTGAPYLLIDRMGISPQLFGALSVFFVGGFFCGNLLGRWIGPRHGAKWAVLLGGGFTTLGGGALLASLALHPYQLIEIVAAMFLYQTGTGLVMATAMAAAVARHPGHAGAAAALSGFIQMGGAALGSLLVAGLNDPTGLPMAMLVAGLGGATLLTALSQARQPGTGGA